MNRGKRWRLGKRFIRSSIESVKIRQGFVRHASMGIPCDCPEDCSRRACWARNPEGRLVPGFGGCMSGIEFLEREW